MLADTIAGPLLPRCLCLRRGRGGRSVCHVFQVAPFDRTSCFFPSGSSVHAAHIRSSGSVPHTAGCVASFVAPTDAAAPPPLHWWTEVRLVSLRTSKRRQDARKKHIFRACDASNCSHPPSPNLQCPLFSGFPVFECPPSFHRHDRVGSTSKASMVRSGHECTGVWTSMRGRVGTRDGAQYVLWRGVHSRKDTSVSREVLRGLSDVHVLSSKGVIRGEEGWGFHMCCLGGFFHPVDLSFQLYDFHRSASLGVCEHAYGSMCHCCRMNFTMTTLHRARLSKLRPNLHFVSSFGSASP